MKKVKNAIRYLLVLAGFLVIFKLFPGYFLGLMIVFLIFLGIYDLVALEFLAKKMDISLKLPKEPMIKNNKISILMEVQNPTIFFSGDVTLKMKIYNEFYGDSIETFFHIPVYGKEKETIVLPIEFQYCGKIRITLEEIKILGLLGIMERKKKIQKKEDIFYVFPKKMERQENIKRQEGLTEKIQRKNSNCESTNKGSDFIEVSDIREYIPGDRMRDIHWKLSAKKELLMVKEHVNMSDTRQIILLELAEDIKEEHKIMEEVLEVTAKVMKSFLAQGMGFELFWWNERKKEICHKEVQLSKDISKVTELLLDAKVYQENQLLENLWKSKNHRGESYVWIGKDEKVLEYKIIAKGKAGVIAKWEEG
ncbi:MAG: DUF58 domain-containing protein [Lachnospiraceae bacterium]|nr:DUF58 domain-containing protein [Lachnospiraceae bacterium]